MKKVLKWIVHAIFLSLAYLLTLIATPALAEDNTATYSAKKLASDSINNKHCKKLEGEVVFTFHPSGMVLTADKAYQYDEEERIEAEGNVKIVDKEGGMIQANLLTYYPEKKLAILEHNVICTSKKGEFHTQKLIYDTEKKQGKFLNNGKLLHDQLVLTSSTGVYDGQAQRITFTKEVVLIDPSYTLHCDQLCYHMERETAYFQGFTKITQENITLTTQQGGRYLMPQKHLIFNQGTLTTKDLVLAADCLEAFNGKDYTAIGHVSIQAKAHDAIILGERAKYLEQEKKVEITGNPLLTKVVNNETMYLRAETFIAVEKTTKAAPPVQEIHALNHVRLYQESLQGVADSALYNSTTQTIHLQHKPIIWCNGYQITGKEVSLLIEGSDQVKMLINKNLFMASADPVGNYNQVKGDKMVADFKNGALTQMAITGNSESLYFALGHNNELMGMNHIKCNSMEITMTEHLLTQMTFKPAPTGLFYPAAQLEAAQMQLADFVWYGEQWPKKENML